MQFRLISKGINSNGINNYATINSHAIAKIRKSNTEFNRVLVLKDHPSSNGREIKVVRQGSTYNFGADTAAIV